MFKYVDDCTIVEVASVSSEPSALQDELGRINKWTIDNNIKLNISKTSVRYLFLKEPRDYLEPLSVNNQPLETVEHIKLLGIQLSSDLKWASHINYICTKSSKHLYASL